MSRAKNSLARGWIRPEPKKNSGLSLVWLWVGRSTSVFLFMILTLFRHSLNKMMLVAIRWRFAWILFAWLTWTTKSFYQKKKKKWESVILHVLFRFGFGLLLVFMPIFSSEYTSRPIDSHSCKSLSLSTCCCWATVLISPLLSTSNSSCCPSANQL